MRIKVDFLSFLHKMKWISISLILLNATAQTKLPNIVLLLADDLGYGDTSVFPFVGTGIWTPELVKMASRGLVATKYY